MARFMLRIRHESDRSLRVMRRPDGRLGLTPYPREALTFDSRRSANALLSAMDAREEIPASKFDADDLELEPL